MEATRVTLLQRLGQPDADDAWQEFYEIYGRVLLKYAGKCGLDDALAEDVLQETMMALLRLMPDFNYDNRRGMFRNFLLTMVRGRVANARKRAHMRREICMPAEQLQRLAVKMNVEPAALPCDEIDEKWVESINEEAWRRVVAGLENGLRAMAAVYDANVRNGEPAAEVARRFDVSEDFVYRTKSRMEQRLARELRKMKKTLELTGDHEIPPAR